MKTNTFQQQMANAVSSSQCEDLQKPVDTEMTQINEYDIQTKMLDEDILERQKKVGQRYFDYSISWYSKRGKKICPTQPDKDLVACFQYNLEKAILLTVEYFQGANCPFIPIESKDVYMSQHIAEKICQDNHLRALITFNLIDTAILVLNGVMIMISCKPEEKNVLTDIVYAPTFYVSSNCDGDWKDYYGFCKNYILSGSEEDNLMLGDIPCFSSISSLDPIADASVINTYMKEIHDVNSEYKPLEKSEFFTL